VTARRTLLYRLGSAFAVLGLAFVAALLVGAWRWNGRTRDLRTALEASRTAPVPSVFDPRGIEPLPAPVRRFFEVALRPGQPLVTGAHLTTEGTFLMDAARNTWAPFKADQLFVVRPPGFDWDARIRMGSGISVFVRDAYRGGSGLLRAEVAGLVTVAAQEGAADLARGELMRWLAEACWFPTALLPGPGVRWEPVDESRARVTIEDHGVEASLEFRFGRDGLVASVFAPDRPRTVGGSNVPSPWEGSWTAWSPRNGMRVPSAGEVAWLLPEGRLPYWRGRVTSVAYTFADAGPAAPPR
jgi:hypothetical protein